MRVIKIWTLAACIGLLMVCGGSVNAKGVSGDVNATKQQGKTKMTLQIDGTNVKVKWKDNESIAALRKLVKDKPLTISMSMYGGFEQVGAIGSSLPRNDKSTTTAAGDIVLYSGNQIVVFYGSNSWSYTRLGKIKGMSAKELAELLGNGDVKLTIATDAR